MKKCDLKNCDAPKVCWQGLPKGGGCPLKALENEKLFLSILLVLSISLLVWYAIGV